MGRAARVEKGWIVHSHWQAGRSADRVRGWSPEFGEQKEKAAAVPRPGEGLECLAPGSTPALGMEPGPGEAAAKQVEFQAESLGMCRTSCGWGGVLFRALMKASCQGRLQLVW